MSFGRPPGFTTFSVTPPDRGSFPLDHEGECTTMMKEYMTCLKAHKNDSGQCRHLSRRYLECRMEKGLMEKDEMSNLGFRSQDKAGATPGPGSNAGPEQQQQSPASPPIGKHDAKEETAAGKSGSGRGWFGWIGSGSKAAGAADADQNAQEGQRI